MLALFIVRGEVNVSLTHLSEQKKVADRQMQWKKKPNPLFVRNLTSYNNHIELLANYSETSCSFARHFAIFSRNVGILIGSLLRASCELKFQLAVSCNWFSAKTPWWKPQLSITITSPFAKTGFPTWSTACKLSSKKWIISNPLEGPSKIVINTKTAMRRTVGFQLLEGLSCYVRNSDLALFSRPRFRQKNEP